jgi:putative redox protein
MTVSASKVKARWRGSFSGSGFVSAPGFETRVTLPQEFKGLGEDATPEDLLLSALASCYLITLGILLEKNDIAYESLGIVAEISTTTDLPPRIDKVHLKPEIVSDVAPATLLLQTDQALKFCLISRAIDGNVAKTVQPIFRRIS